MTKREKFVAYVKRAFTVVNVARYVAIVTVGFAVLPLDGVRWAVALIALAVVGAAERANGFSLGAAGRGES